MRGALLAIALAVAAPVAQASVLPSEYLLRRIAKQHAGYKNIQMKSHVTPLEDGEPAGAGFDLETRFDVKAGVVYTVAYSDTGEVVYESKVNVGKEYVYKERRDGSEERPSVYLGKNAASPSLLLMLSGNPFFLAKRLVRDGVPIRTETELRGYKSEEERRKAEIVTLKRIFERPEEQEAESEEEGKEKKRKLKTIAYVVGKGRARLMVQKDKFLPLELQTADELKVEFQNYRTYKNFPFARQVVFNKDDVSFREELAGQPIFNQKKFEIPKEIKAGFSEKAQGLNPKTQELLRAFFELGR